jgi:hypothetical protein
MTDRLTLTRALEGSGMQSDAAERIACEIYDAIHNNVATKSDLRELEQRLHRRFTAVDLKFEKLERQIDRVVTRLVAAVVIALTVLFGALHFNPSGAWRGAAAAALFVSSARRCRAQMCLRGMRSARARSVAQGVSAGWRAAVIQICGVKIMRDCRGNLTIEFAILFPVLFLLLVGGIEFGMVIIERMPLEFATEAAAKCLATYNPISNPNRCNSLGATADYAAGLMAPGWGISASNFIPTRTAYEGCVTSSYTYRPMILPTTIPLGTNLICYPIS